MAVNNNVNYTITANDLISSKLKTINSNTNGLEKSMGGLQTAIVAAFSVAAVTTFVSSVVKAGTTVEDATTGLTTLLGNSAEAAQVVKNTMEDATKTPFSFEGLLAGNKALIAAGVSSQQAREDVLNLGNAIAATGGGNDELQRMVVNMQQIKNVGYASSQDIKQFAFAGINVYKALAEATGQPIEKIKGMKISYDLLTSALEKAHDKGGIYYHGLENMAENTSVKISNVGDALFQFYNDIFVASKPLINSALTGVLKFVGALKAMITWAKANEGVVKLFARLVGIIALAVLLYKGWLIATNLMIGAQAILNAVMAVNPIFLIITAIALLVALIYSAIESYDKWGATLLMLLGPLGWVINLVMSFYNHWDSIVQAFKKDGIIAGIKRIGEVLMDAILYPMQQILEMMAKWTGMDFLSTMAKTVKDYRKSLDLVTAGEGKTDTGATDTWDAPVEKVKKGPVAPMAMKKTKADKVSGTKLTTIYISIGSLVKDMTFNTTNMKESSDEIQKAVVNALTNALADSQLIVK